MPVFAFRIFAPKDPLFLNEVVADEKYGFRERSGKPQLQMENPGEQLQKSEGLDAENNGREGVIFEKCLAVGAVCAKDPFAVEGEIEERRNDPRDQCRKLHGADRGDLFVQYEQQNIVYTKCRNG